LGIADDNGETKNANRKYPFDHKFSSYYKDYPKAIIAASSVLDLTG
jgi:hypothetical protein